MRNFPTRKDETPLPLDGHAEVWAHSGGNSEVGFPALATEVPSLNDVPARGASRTAVSRVSFRITTRAMRLVVVICALSLGQTTTAENASFRKDAVPPSTTLRAALALRLVSDARVPVERAKDVSIHASNGRSFRLIDDVAWDDPEGDDNESDEPITCFQELGRYLSAYEFGSAPPLTESPFSVFFASQRLRC